MLANLIDFHQLALILIVIDSYWLPPIIDFIDCLGPGFSVVCTLIDKDTSQWSKWPLWWCLSLSIRVQTRLNHIWFLFTTISKKTKEIFVKICWQLKTPTCTWRCICCTMQMGYLYASDFLFKNFCKLAQHVETICENVWEKGNNVYSLLITVQTTINHISICFLPQYQCQRNCFCSLLPKEV